jgi:hypothetical protein
MVKTFFYDLAKIKSWKKEYLNHIYNEVLEEISFVPKEKKPKLKKLAKKFFLQKAIASLESMSQSISEYKYFNELNKFVSDAKLSQLEMKEFILNSLQEDFPQESTYSIQFNSLLPDYHHWKEFSIQMANKSILHIIENLESITPDHNQENWKKYRFRIKPPSATGKLVDESKIFKIRVTEKNKYNQLINANNSLKQIWSYGYSIFHLLTDRIHILRSKGMVSYSHFIEQGITYLNLWDRDFIDTIDDLIHENGHHHLNLILKKFKLMSKNDPNEIYFSPWRLELRSFYAIFHSVFTFTWGSMLFEQLLLSFEKNNKIISANWEDKIKFRFLEEVICIEYSLNDLKIGSEKGLLTLKGKALLKELNSINQNHLLKIDSIEKSLTLKHRNQLKKIKIMLQKKRKEFQLNS